MAYLNAHFRISPAIERSTSPGSGDPVIGRADRTGLMSAAYRISVQGWSREEAASEMVTGGFGYHSVYGKPVEFILSFGPHSDD